MTVWVFGDSLSTAHGFDDDKSWPKLLAKRFNTECVNFAKPAADNLYIYHCYLYQLKHIRSNDVVITGWTHPSRKSFVFDSNNPSHVESLPKSFLYDSTDTKFIRSRNPVTDTIRKWLDFKPEFKGNPYYDSWFSDYYSEIEQRINLTAYHNAVKSTCPGTHVPFFFSKQSIEDLDLSGAGCAVDFIVNNNCAISDQDAHFNMHGHQLWTDLLHKYFLTQRQQSLFPVIELLDRLAIARIKHQRIGNNQAELDFYQKQAKFLDLSLIETDLSNLEQIHNQIWELEKELKTGRDSELPLEEIGRRAIKIRDWNNKRIGIKNFMAEKLSCPIREIKKDHLSE